MKRLVKAVLKPVWRSTAPLRRPFLRKFENYLARCLRPTERFLADETMILLDQVVRELVRLQRQVDDLRRAVDDLEPSRDSLSIAGEIEPSERLRAG